MAASARITNYARALALCGVDVKVVIAKRTEVYGQQTSNIAGDGLVYGIPFHYISGTPARSRRLPERKFRDLLDVFATLRFLKRELSAGDAVIGYLDDHPFLVSRLLGWCSHNKVRYVSELCEYPYETNPSLSALKWLERQYVLKRLFPRFDGVIAISDFLAEFARKHCKDECKVGKIPILVDFEAFNITDRSEEQQVPFLFHCGTLYDKKDGFSGLLEAFGRAVRDYGIKARFVSTGSLENAQHPGLLRSIINRYGLEDKVSFTGYISREEISRLLAGAALVVINKPDNLQNRSNFSTKLGEYLSAGKPVIHTAVGEAVNYLEDGVNACLVPCGDRDALSNSIARCLTHPEEARRMGEAGRELCHRSFDFSRNGEALLKICEVE